MGLRLASTISASLLALAGLFNPAAAQDFEFPNCRDVDGQSVNFRPVTRDHLRRAGVGIAMAYYDAQGRPYVDYDEERLKTTPRVYWRHVFAHECAHHELGHTKLPMAAYEADKEKIEREADCKAFRGLGYGRREIDVIVATDEKLYPTSKVPGISWSKPDRRNVLMGCLKTP